MKSAWLVFLFCALAAPTLAQPAAVETGLAAYYNDNLHGRRTFSGEPYDRNQFTCAHKTLPMGTWLLVTNPKTGQAVRVRVNDRLGVTSKHVVDLSRAAAASLDVIRHGVVPVTVQVLPADGLTASAKPGAAPTGNNPAPVATGSSPNPQAAQLLATTSGRQLKLLGTYDSAFRPQRPTGYGLQLATYRDVANAKALYRQLAATGRRDVYLRIFVEQTQASEARTGQEYRVLVGQGSETYVRQTLLPYFQGQGFANCTLVKHD
ncbi:MAG: septal ring lytic transglycosylase RlpA family protein [Bernardetiaceae bacterium]|nr:septal ring lytic transglycosylase RlpA family protein [Bernardetiaceae bacterium]